METNHHHESEALPEFSSSSFFKQSWNEICYIEEGDDFFVLPEEIDSFYKYKIFLQDTDNEIKFHCFCHSYLKQQPKKQSLAQLQTLIDILEKMAQHLAVCHPEKKDHFELVQRMLNTTAIYARHIFFRRKFVAKCAELTQEMNSLLVSIREYTSLLAHHHNGEPMSLE